MKSEKLIHFALRTQQETVDLLQKISDKDKYNRKLRTVASEALKIGAEVIAKRERVSTR